MKMLKFLTLCLLAAQTFPVLAHAESASKQYQIVDGEAEITGEPDRLEAGARTKWTTACNDWKKELKELNGNQLMALSCNSPKCSFSGSINAQCTSQANYKIKIDGALIPAAPEVVKQPESNPVIVQTPPPTEVVEIIPETRPGFIWTVGYWGWVGHRHIWYPGHWIAERPGYVWVGHSWAHRGHDWEFNYGHWGRR